MQLTSSQRNWIVFTGATAVTATASAIYFDAAAVNDDSIRLALRRSAQLSFCIFLVVFVARPLRQLIRTPSTLALVKNRRLLGVAFAGVHTAHLGLILYRDQQVAEFDFSIAESLLGGLTYGFIYLMFLTSFDATTRALGPRNWRVLHKLGLYWILLAFLPTLLPESRAQLVGANGLLVLLAAAAIVVRLTAYLARRRTGQDSDRGRNVA